MAATSPNGSGGSSSTVTTEKKPAAQQTPEQPKSLKGNGALKFKDGAYLTPKVERIMLQIARGKTVEWIAQLYDVRESFVYFVARKTGFPASAVIREKKDSDRVEARDDGVDIIAQNLDEPEEEVLQEEIFIDEEADPEGLEDTW